MDDDAFPDLLLPASWGRPTRPLLPTFSALHGAYHVLHRRVQLELLDVGLGPSEAVVLATLTIERDQTVAEVRRRTGLRASTLGSLLDRLETRDLLGRSRQRAVRGEVTLELTRTGNVLAGQARSALVEIEEELAVFASGPSLAAVQVVFEASRALGVPGTAADI
jgi:DNA-binding MarR family transcriptional regulator